MRKNEISAYFRRIFAKKNVVHFFITFQRIRYQPNILRFLYPY
jgi:hypothetical protein